MTSRIQSVNLVRNVSRWSIVAVAAAVFVCGLVWRNATLLGVGAAILCFILRRAWDGASNDGPSRARTGGRKRENEGSVRVVRNDASTSHGNGERNPVEGLAKSDSPPRSTDALVDELLANGRYALMLRPETKQHLTQFQLMRAVRQLDEAMALVPAGRVLVGQLAEQSNSACGQADVDPKLTQSQSGHGRAGLLGSLLRHERASTSSSSTPAATSSSNSGTKKRCRPCSISSIKPAHPGRAIGATASIRPANSDLPVVGISWFEAWAYARWVGKRLPTDAEWTKAAAWPVESAPGRIAQRRYPWGESFDVRRAHLYGSGSQRPGGGRRISRRHQRRRHPPADRQRLGMDVDAAGGAGRPDAARFGIGDEHSRRRVRHVFRKPGHLPLPKRRASALAAPQHRLPPRTADERFGSYRRRRPTTVATESTPKRPEPARTTAPNYVLATRIRRYAVLTSDLRPLALLTAMTHLAQMPLETYLLAEQAAPIACLVCDHENCCSAARCRNCSAPMSLAHKRSRSKKRPQLIAVIGASGAGKTVYLGLLMDMLTRHVGPAAIDRPRADVDFAAANDDHGPGHRLVPGKNGDHARTLALGALSIQLPAAAPAAGAGDSRRFGRSAGRRDRACRPLSGDSLAAGQSAPASWCWPMPSGCKPATIRRISSRSSCCR